ncbi:3-deoxy-D-manno-octulosonic acid kinase [Thalassotalea sp. PLHSN55]|uniref:3-deoxy-D-manno-octulosonic acid kinase n=1 Tax=Thalassotalea sp. PLHSN55 TaxID=3435888 RepID=UPI003F85D19E
MTTDKNTATSPIIHTKHNNVFCLHNQQLIEHFEPEMLSSQYWLAKQQVVGQAHGRGITYFIETAQQNQWVLRHYYRGGLIGKLINDSYFFSSLAATRAFAEFNLLTLMHDKGLPAPKPVACRVVKNGLTYQADLLSSRIENAQDLVGVLSKQSLSAEQWQNVGQVIASFHQQGIYHHDLNAHNILLDSQDKVWLIDFDRGEQRNVDIKWQQANLARLLRSFEKEHGKIANFHWQKSHWQQLMAGYNR